MTTPTGQISAADLRNEFGESGGEESVSLGAYRVSATYGALSNLPLDTGVPQSGQISFNDLRGKQLNVIVNYYSSNETRPQTARARYNANSSSNVKVVGGFKGRPGESAGCKIRVHVNKTISGGTGANNCALRTGTWDSSTDLQIDVGEEAKIYGAGGNGGGGGNDRSSGHAGGDGTHALGIEYGTTGEETIVSIRSGGLISCGYGGGGGGSADHQSDKGEERNVVGGGGGGGAGSPVGSGGDKGEGDVRNSQDGSNGDHDHGGDGGAGGENDNQAHGGNGGEGGGAGGAATAGQNKDWQGGAKGDDGDAIRGGSGITSADIQVVNNGGTIRGSTSYNKTIN